MASNESTKSGGSWEYVSQSGDPGLDLYTSLAHPWGGAATYILTECALAVRPVQGLEGFGYKRWVIRPKVGVELGLKSTSGKVETSYLWQPSRELGCRWWRTARKCVCAGGNDGNYRI